MAHRIKYKVKCIPYEDLTSNEGTLHKTLSSEVLRKLGGSGTSVQLYHPFDGPIARQGYADGVPYYVNAAYGAQTSISAELDGSLIFIKNTGHAYSSATELGGTLDLSLKVMAGSSDKECIGVLEPGGAMVLPCNTADNISCSNIYVQTVNHDGTATTAGSVAVTFLIGGVDNGRTYGVLCPVELTIIGSGT